jgi:hypothetical protein
MKKLIFAITLTLFATIVSAQLKGSGKTVTKKYDYQNFDAINFDDIDGKIELTMGLTWSITITIDDNLLPLLSFKENKTNRSLSVFFKGNNDNKMYIEDTNVRIKITMPSAMAIHHAGNSSLIVANLNENQCSFENLGNASTTLLGTISNIDIKNNGNGTVNASNLMAKTAKVKSIGNGNVTVNISESITGNINGNGDIYNKGKAKFDASSSKIGNGNLINL